MQGAVVDDGIAGFGHAEDLVDDVVVLGEDIQPKRMRVAVLPSRAGERAAATALPNVADVLVVGGEDHVWLVVRVARGDGCAAERCDADTMKARCEKACGKLPIRRFARVSYSSENMPTSFCRPRRRSNSLRASCSRPMRARLSTNQNVVIRNVPSPAGRPSTESSSDVG